MTQTNKEIEERIREMIYLRPSNLIEVRELLVEAQKLLLSYVSQARKEEAEQWQTAIKYNCEPDDIERILKARKALK